MESSLPSKKYLLTKIHAPNSILLEDLHMTEDQTCGNYTHLVVLDVMECAKKEGLAFFYDWNPRTSIDACIQHFAFSSTALLDDNFSLAVWTPTWYNNELRLD